MQWFDEEEEERRRKGLLEGAISMPQEDPGPATSDRLGQAITSPQTQRSQPPAKFAEVISAAKQVPSPALSSTGDPNSNGLLSNAIKDDSNATVNKGTLSQLGGGDLVDSWNDVKTAQEELGSFSDSAGKWWSVLLAAMFPQYGSALNMIGGMKENKYKSARDKYATAFDSLHRKSNYMEVDNRVWDPATRQFLTDKVSKDKFVNYYAETPEGTKIKRARENEDFDPYYTIPGKQYQGPTPSGAPIDERSDDEKYPYMDPSSYRTTFREGALDNRTDRVVDARAEAADKLERHQKMLVGMREGVQMRAERLHADLKDYIGAASYMAAKSLSEDLSLIGAPPEKLDAALMERTGKYAAQMKAEQQKSLGKASVKEDVKKPAAGNSSVITY